MVSSLPFPQSCPLSLHSFSQATPAPTSQPITSAAATGLALPRGPPLRYRNPGSLPCPISSAGPLRVTALWLPALCLLPASSPLRNPLSATSPRLRLTFLGREMTCEERECTTLPHLVLQACPPFAPRLAWPRELAQAEKSRLPGCGIARGLALTVEDVDAHPRGACDSSPTRVALPGGGCSASPVAYTRIQPGELPRPFASLPLRCSMPGLPLLT